MRAAYVHHTVGRRHVDPPAAACWPQSSGGMRRIGALFGQARRAIPKDKRALAALRQGLAALGWVEGKNLEIDLSLGGRRAATACADHAADLVRSKSGGDACKRNGRPLVSTATGDAHHPHRVRAGDRSGRRRLRRRAWRGRAATSPASPSTSSSIGRKWLELLKQIAPHVTHVAVLYDPGNPATAGYLRAIEPAAQYFFGGGRAGRGAQRGRDRRAPSTRFAAKPNGGLIVLPGPVGAANRNQIIALAGRHRLPSVYAFRYHVVSGGLASYGVDNIDLFRRAAWYVDRIIKGQKPAELPVQNADQVPAGDQPQDRQGARPRTCRRRCSRAPTR